MMVVKNFEFCDEVVRHRECAKNDRRIIDRSFIVAHYTASTNAESTMEYLCDRGVEASAHVLIDREGRVTQMVDFDLQAWHAGKSSYRGLRNMNAHSLGIELVNAGLLTRRADEFFSWCGERVDAAQVFECREKDGKMSYWQAYTEMQVAAFVEVCRALIRAYPEIEEVVGHEDVCERKLDPGPALPLRELEFFV